MSNEDLNKVIQQLGEIGALIEQFSEIAAEMKKSVDTAVSGLKKEKTDIEDVVKSITSASSKWEDKLSSVLKDVNDATGKIANLAGSIVNLKKLLDERVTPIDDYSEICSSIFEQLNVLTKLDDRLLTVVEKKISDEDTKVRLDRIEKAIESQAKNEERILGILSEIVHPNDATTADSEAPDSNNEEQIAEEPKTEEENA